MAVLAVAGAVKTLSEDRNLIVHGTWGELDGVPSVGSLRLETIDRNDVTFESFPPDRLRDFIRGVTDCRDQAMAIIAEVESSSGQNPPQISSGSLAAPSLAAISARRFVAKAWCLAVTGSTEAPSRSQRMAPVAAIASR